MPLKGVNLKPDKIKWSSLRLWEVSGNTLRSQTEDFKLLVEAPLSDARHIKDSSTQKKLVDPLKEYCDCAEYHTTACNVIFQ